MNKSTVINYFGGVTETAVAIGVSHSAVSQWPDAIPYSAIGRIACMRPNDWVCLMNIESEVDRKAA